jgi:predicted dinucleotide-binding enzyme
MTYSIIGSGNVGIALARQFARGGIVVNIANTRGPDSIASIVNDLGVNAVPVTLTEALKADVIIMAVPFRAHTAVACMLPSWGNKIIVDAMNTYGIPADEFKGQTSTDIVASAFSGAQVVKTFNQLAAPLLARDPAEYGGRRLMFLSSNDAGAESTIAKLVANLGFAPILLGKLSEAAPLISYGANGVAGPLVLQNLVKHG